MSYRFGLLMDPLGMTGLMWFALRTYTGLSQYPVFKVQAAANDVFHPTFSPAECRCVVFGGKEVRYRFCLAVSTTSWNILSTRFRVGSEPSSKRRGPLDRISAHMCPGRARVRQVHSGGRRDRDGARGPAPTSVRHRATRVRPHSSASSPLKP